MEGTSISVSPTRTLPWWMVPVTTVPVPSRVKLRSIARRKACGGFFVCFDEWLSDAGDSESPALP